MPETKMFRISAFKDPMRVFRVGPGTEFDDPSIIYIMKRGASEYIVRSTHTGEMSGLGNTLSECSSNAKKLFTEVEHKYGVRVAPAHFVVSNWSIKKAPGAESLFILTERIVAYQNADDVTKLKRSHMTVNERKRLAEEYLTTCRSLLHYYGDKVRADGGANTHGSCLSDIGNPRQYMWGKRQDDVENHLYLVDTDPQTFGVWNALVDFGEFLQFGLRTLKLDMSKELGDYRALLNTMKPDQAEYFIKRAMRPNADRY